MTLPRCEIVEESTSDVIVKLRLPQLHYLDEFVRLKCAPTLINQKLFPNVKEISESMTAFNTIRRYVGAKSFSQPWTLLDVACGHAPRTAALFAHMTCWDCHAIDPLLKKKPRFMTNKRLTLWDCIIEKMEPISADVVVVTAVHAHVKLQHILQKISANRVVMLAMPCCKPLNLPDREPQFEFEDMGCLSPRRTVKLYDIISLKEK